MTREKKNIEINKKYKQRAWAVMFRHLKGWTVVEIFHSPALAGIAMDKWIKQLPDFKYKVVPCEIWVAWHYIAGPAHNPSQAKRPKVK